MEHSGHSHWIPLSDLMTGLMMVFLLIAIAFMVQVESSEKALEASTLKVREAAQVSTTIVTDYENTRSDLRSALQDEFKDDLKRWNAEILGDMTIRFRDPEVLFLTGSSDIRDRFKEILRDFLPRYVRILTSPKYKSSIREVRIEGHTSRFWASARSNDEAYMKNMELSQARTRQTLEFVLSLDSLQSNLAWLRTVTTANGRSFSQLIKGPDGKEDPLQSQRVEFKVVTNADEKMTQLLDALAAK
jgi:outer membrane protein OmpA-like peptidoglycan-associated protein